MKFWNFSSTVLAGLLSVVALSQAAGPGEGEALADPNSAVVQLTTETFKSFIDENPLVLAEFFAPWCGYCKMLGPEYSVASDILKESNPNIKLAQIDCTVEEELCQAFDVKGYPTLKIFRGAESIDYDGPREAAGIADYMFKQALPAVQIPEDVTALKATLKDQTKPFVVFVNPTSSESESEVFEAVAKTHRKDYSFIAVSDAKSIKALKTKFRNVDLNVDKSGFYIVHPGQYNDVRTFEAELSTEALNSFVSTEVIPYFGDINRNTYMSYMSSPLPIAYYFYNNPKEQAAVVTLFNRLGKQYKGKIHFVGLDASLYGKHAEVLSMQPEIVPLFAIQNSSTNKKYGVDQTEHPNGPSEEVIEQFVTDFFAGTLEPIIKSEPLPTEEEVAATPVVRLVAHNYNDVIGDVSKDVFVKYYAPWCGHCKKLAPVWEELAEIYVKGNETNVVIAHIDHSANDVETSIEIEGYPTLLLYPANGEIDPKTGLRTPVVFEGSRDLDGFVSFVKDLGAHKVDGKLLKRAEEDEIVEDDEDEEEETKGEAAKKVVEEAAKKVVDEAAEVVEDVTEPVKEAAKDVVEEAEVEHDEL